MNLGTFVCSKCVEMIRELNYPVKGIGLSNFKEEEINFINEMGNEVIMNNNKERKKDMVTKT